MIETHTNILMFWADQILYISVIVHLQRGRMHSFWEVCRKGSGAVLLGVQISTRVTVI
jgi:hypothetical protein